MAKSPEYPDLPWVPPRSWSEGRPGGAPRVVVIHTTEGSSHERSAEDGAAYDARRTDGTSTHFFHDVNSTIQCVDTGDRAHTARATGNKIGIHHELCARASYGFVWWTDSSYARPMLQRCARQVARDCRKWKIPIRRLSVQQLRAGAKGIVGHHDISLAFGESTHTDPGGSFPWGLFIGMVQDAYNEQFAPKPAAVAAGAGEENDMATGHLKAGEKRGEVVIKKGDRPSAVHLLVTGGDLRVRVGARKAGADEAWRGVKDVTLRDGDDRVDIELDPRCNGVYIEADAPDGTDVLDAGELAYIVDCNR